MNSNPTTTTNPSPSKPTPSQHPKPVVLQPNGQARPKVIKKKAADPLVRKKPAPKPRGQGNKPSSYVSALQGGVNSRNSHAGQTNVQQEEYEDTYIYTTKRALADGLKHHVLRFVPAVSSAEQTVNVFDSSQFERPVRLHRRDPRVNHLGHLDDIEQEDNPQEQNNKATDSKEKERQELLKAEKKAEREANQALIAPTSKSQKPKKDKPQKQYNNVQTFSDSVNKQKTMAIRYEEKLPWHVEDFENKQTWRGTYETHLSENHIALVKGKDSNGQDIFHMIPLQKWYKFTRKNQFKTLSFQEAEKSMIKGARDPLWIRKARIAEERERRQGVERQVIKGVFARKAEKGEGVKVEDDDVPEAAVDGDDIDFNAEEDFADDEEGPAPVGKEAEEEAKEVSDRVKKEQLEANLFEFKEQKDWDAEEEELRRREEAEEKHKRRTQKALMRREKNYAYESNGEGSLSSSEEAEDSEIERQKQEELRREEERKQGDVKAGKEKVSSSASTARAGTPSSSKPVKADDPRRKVLKRAGSPSLSDASGNESSSRKKLKKKHGASQLAANGASISRPGSPPVSATNGGPNIVAPAPQRPGAKINLDPTVKAGSQVRSSGSDVEMSDGGTARQKQKGSSNTSPRGSRPGSPEGTSLKKPGKSFYESGVMISV